MFGSLHHRVKLVTAVRGCSSRLLRYASKRLVRLAYVSAELEIVVVEVHVAKLEHGYVRQVELGRVRARFD